MRETPLSNCERDFLLKAIQEKKRLEGRQTYDYRNIKITFGTDYGCCIVDLGKTRVLAQVSCELVAPKESRPTEGILFFNLELSPMASPSFELGRQSELLVKLNRLLERCLRNSKCIDTESLCVVSGEKVWQIRVDVHGEEVTVYSADERDPIPLSIYHMPICVSFSFFLQGTYLLVDPCEREERVMDGLLVIAMNKHREICSIQSSGGIMLLKEQVLRCSKIASVKVSEITDLISRALENDKRVRKEGGKFGFAESIPKQRITALKSDEAAIEMTDMEEKAEGIISSTEPPSEPVPSPVVRAPGTGQVGESLENAWGVEQLEEEEEDSVDHVMDEGQEKEEEEEEESQYCNKADVVVISDSEEEEVVVLHQEAQVDSKQQVSGPQQPGTGDSKKKKKKKKKPVQ
ncbi:hypothetical protein AGOR_G00188830 [Albula goreensis]|uniref:Exosome complex component RRP45 n=1 Tax=Albula goreensis TaxID=1534307 RepID=A0A8T3CSG6_9TELE|nr:hypothetical protein AGOR_G00188830 [Albula goreensis]